MCSKSTLKKSCDKIIGAVRSSGLNFSYQETPFSMYFTIRKSIVKIKNSQEEHETFPDNENSEAELEALKSDYYKLKLDYEDAIKDAEAKYSENLIQESQIKNLHEKLSESDSKRAVTEQIERITQAEQRTSSKT